MTSDNHDTEKQRARRRPWGPFSNLICWRKGHNWVDDPFMGDGQECTRCGALDQPVTELLHGKRVSFVLGWVAGVFTGIMVAGAVIVG